MIRLQTFQEVRIPNVRNISSLWTVKIKVPCPPLASEESTVFPKYMNFKWSNSKPELSAALSSHLRGPEMIGHLSMPPKKLTLISVLFWGLDRTYSLDFLIIPYLSKKCFLTQVSQTPFLLISIKYMWYQVLIFNRRKGGVGGSFEW